MLIRKMVNKKKVLVAMSGGVDSSITAALLKHKGFEVIGATMKIKPEDNWLKAGEAGERSCLQDDVREARKIARNLGIAHYVFDFREIFKKKVIDYFIEAYCNGFTPNPCIICNRFIKFGALLSKASELGADYFATGHYASVYWDPERGRYLLARPKDKKKDQTYFLYGLSQEQLARTLFPLGGYTKHEVRRLAQSMGLGVVGKPESQEICFVPDNDYRRFLTKRVPSRIKPGPFMDTNGKKVGCHKGIALYTVGQRRGLGLALGYPVYVVDVDAAANIVIVGKKEDAYSKGLIATQNNFILWDKLESEKRVVAKVRYRTEGQQAVITPLGNGEVEVKFEERQWAVTPGQAVVYYEEDLVAGGGIIKNRIN